MTRLDENALLRSQLAELEVSLQALKEENAMLRDDVRMERAAVVAWLRKCEMVCLADDVEDAVSWAYGRSWRAIERGEHRREEGA
jgi:hypothetical protein